MPAPVWFFDLDNTLHDASFRVFPAINRTMTEYVMRHLRLDEPEADRLRVDYWRRYGATLLGLVRHHAVDADHFLRDTHRFCETGGFAAMLRAERGLAEVLRRLPGRKVLVTNAPLRYAGAVLGHIGIDRHFTRRYAIENMRIHGRFRPKPARFTLKALLAREGVPAARAVLVEDSLENLRSARAVGMRTVQVVAWQSRHIPVGYAGRQELKGRPSYVGLRIESLRQLNRRRRFLR